MTSVSNPSRLAHTLSASAGPECGPYGFSLLPAVLFAVALPAGWCYLFQRLQINPEKTFEVVVKISLPYASLKYAVIALGMVRAAGAVCLACLEVRLGCKGAFTCGY